MGKFISATAFSKIPSTAALSQFTASLLLLSKCVSMATADSGSNCANWTHRLAGIAMSLALNSYLVDDCCEFGDFGSMACSNRIAPLKVLLL